MGRQKSLFRRVLYIVAVHCMLCGSRGHDVARPPDLPANPPDIHEAASGPVYSHSIAPSPVTPPQESASHPSPTLPPTFEPVSPNIHTVIPSAQPPFPTDHVGAGDKWPRTTSPSMDSPSNSPDGSGPAMSPTFITSPVIHGEGYGVPVAAPPKKFISHISPIHTSHPKGAAPASSTVPHDAALAPSALHPQPPVERTNHSPASPPVVLNHQHVAGKGNPAAAPSSHYPPTSYLPGPPLSPIQSPSPSLSSITPDPDEWPAHSSMLSPSGSISEEPRATSPQPIWALPPPPPNLGCISLACPEPLTNPPPGSPCSCVLPIKVGLQLDVALYTFFPLVSEFAQEIASGIYLKQSQVRIMGANAASEQLEKTVVLMHLVPLGEKFDNTTAFLTFEKFWQKQVIIKTSLFGHYEVLYITYPGLPPSPPSAPADMNLGEGMYGNSNSSRTIKPLGVDVSKQKEKLRGSVIAIIILSSILALMLCIGAAWRLLLKQSDHTSLPVPHTLLPTFAKSSGTAHMLLGRRPSSASASFDSSFAAYSGSAKTFTLSEIERATNKFDASRIIGEGGFGCVYHGTLEDGAKVAVKVLKRDDQQGGREFLAEVEMLSRLHHRNLVKLIGICTEEHVRCLVYELIPNGSVESHLHGVDKDTAPLDWNARMKIALGAARGLAYLHEDSSPPVIHRDFKSSNILLDHKFTPKVSDFGLARVALNEGNQHISTRVMGTFGYVAPEYAMTGHLLVKSDVYSYGVVLLELLTGRKPVDMSQPFGQENLVTWARPLLTSVEGLKTIIDSSLGTDVPFDNLAKVAAIASMCVQPEVSHRPFIGEVVQALKLVCNECDNNGGSGSCSLEVISAPEIANRIGTVFDIEPERVLSASDIFSASAMSARDESDSFQRQFSSGPLRTGRSKQFWQRLSSLSTGSMSEHGLALRLERDREGDEHWSS